MEHILLDVKKKVLAFRQYMIFDKKLISVVLT